jgi:CheY-like chemotaxis protein/HPt (histidine-containing phosphotransfer) domain-containing protein
LFTPRAEQKNLLLSADTKTIARRTLHGDAARLRQIVLNLVSNAIKFTPRGAVTILVATSEAGPSQTLVRCEVLDTGPGVNEEAKKRLFKPFAQGDGSINRRFGGTGLGLSICKRLVELMEGRIGVADRPGGGSAFWFEVVLRDAAAGLDQIPARAATEAQSASARRPGRILLAEDNVFNIDLATAILESAGYTVDVATDGVAAVSAVGRRRYDLILMDMQMPELDGLAATREIRCFESGGARVPIIAMTANAMKEDQRRCLEAGMDDYFSKPFSPASLIEKVAMWIDRFATSAPAPRTGDREAGQAPEVIDVPAIEDLVSCLSLAKFVVMLRRFLTEAEEQMRTLARLDPSTALEEIGRQAHQLLASSGTFGARQVHQLAADLQAACFAGDVASAQALIDRIGPAFVKAAAALRAKYASDPQRPLHDGKTKARAAGAPRRAKRRGRVAGAKAGG